MSDFEDFESALRINKLTLDDHLETQPELYHRVGKAYVAAVDNRDTQKEGLERLYAELDHEYRADHEAEGSKYTETSIRSEIKQDSRYVAAQADFLDAVKEAALWQSLKESFGQRAYALRDLAMLYGSEYFYVGAVKGSKETVGQAEAEAGRQALAAARSKSRQKRLSIQNVAVRNEA